MYISALDLLVDKIVPESICNPVAYMLLVSCLFCYFITGYEITSILFCADYMSL